MKEEDLGGVKGRGEKCNQNIVYEKSQKQIKTLNKPKVESSQGTIPKEKNKQTKTEKGIIEWQELELEISRGMKKICVLF